ncbi:MAG: YraN family protein [Alphaproteobacteria bacterium]|nr:YraN family protein [Alphaproteobacteria bacterium]
MPFSHKHRAYRFGITAEWLVMVFYFIQGYRLVCWRYRCSYGEIDLVFKRGTLLIFIEVKARRNSHETVEKTIGYKQRRRIKRAAQFFIATHPRFHHFSYRIDAILISRHGKSSWIKEAW